MCLCDCYFLSKFTHLSYLFDRITSISESLAGVVEMPALLATAADFCQRLSLNTSHIMFRGSDSYPLPKGCSPTTNGTGWGGWSGMGKSLSSTDCALATNNQTSLKYFFFVLQKGSNLEHWWGAHVCTSSDSQRRAVLKWKQSWSCQGTLSPCVCVCEFEHVKVLCTYVFIVLAEHLTGQYESVVCYHQQGVTCCWVSLFWQSRTISNTDKLAQKLC